MCSTAMGRSHGCHLGLPADAAGFAGFAAFAAVAVAGAADGGGGSVGNAEEPPAGFAVDDLFVASPIEHVPIASANTRKMPHAFQFVGGGGFTVGSHW